MNLYIFTEENPKLSSVEVIIFEYAVKRGVVFSNNETKIVPIFKDNKFQHIYEVIGSSVEGIEHIYCVIFTGCSSTIDFMVFEANSLPTPESNEPIMLIEETKTNDCESGNAVYQRVIKFVYAKQYYPSASLYMLYNEEYNVNNSRDSVSKTNVFGTRLMLTMGIKILGRSLDETIFRPFTSLNEFVNAKSDELFEEV
jgi:hypothetical protein